MSSSSDPRPTSLSAVGADPGSLAGATSAARWPSSWHTAARDIRVCRRIRARAPSSDLEALYQAGAPSPGRPCRARRYSGHAQLHRGREAPPRKLSPDATVDRRDSLTA
ncbi:hypothetical protein ZWY2020_021523 [Hordeum vulgare]|nr:hypothetical protein ZWY2020_021523 [Hordeum vulgare]